MIAETTHISDRKKYFSQGFDKSPLKNIHSGAINNTTVDTNAMVSSFLSTSKKPIIVSSQMKAIAIRNQMKPFKVYLFDFIS